MTRPFRELPATAAPARSACCGRTRATRASFPGLRAASAQSPAAGPAAQGNAPRPAGLMLNVNA